MKTIQDIYEKYSGKIDFLDLELIIAHALKKSRELVLAHPESSLTKEQETKIKQFAGRRAKHEPLAYILGQKEFFGLDLKVNEHTLVPRPETELLIEEVLKLTPKNKTIIDLGTGSGNIIVSLAKNIKDKNIFFAIDISSNALSIARQNARTHRVGKKIKFLRGNLLEPFLKKKELRDAIITANLPYLDNGWKNLLKSSDTKGLKYEPDTALYAGKDGLDAYRKLAEQIKVKPAKNIVLFCEIGHGQIAGMKKIFFFAKKIRFHKDLAKRWRICEIRL